jgi:hypothetical protein
MFLFLKVQTMRNPMFSISRSAAIAAVALAACGSAFAAGQEGQTVFKDPLTGQLRNPTASEAKQLNELRAAQRAAAVAERKASGAPQANVVNVLRNGIVQAYLDEESVSYSVVTRDADGQLALQCVTGATAAKETLSNSPSTVSKEPQHEVQ